MIKPRAITRLGIAWKLLLPSVACIILSVAAVQCWTLRVTQRVLQDRMMRESDASLTLLKAYLAPLGSMWSKDGDRLLLGATPVAGRDEVDRAARDIGGTASIFSGDERVATTIRKPDGSSAVGTRLTDPVVREAVLRQGRTYRGVATILGKSYVTIYLSWSRPFGQFSGLNKLGSGVIRPPVSPVQRSHMPHLACAPPAPSEDAVHCNS